MITAGKLEQQLPYHPCMNEHAHTRVARLHLPVAPACNTRCIYCRRGAGLSGHEQRGPGRTAKILSPRQALDKTRKFIQQWGKDSIVGIAGPGDPLANPQTIETLRLLHAQFPDINLCLCTNGLCLSDHLDFLQSIGIRQLTVTVNGVEPAVVSRIQPWILYRGIEYQGLEAAKILISRQLTAISSAVASGIFIKVNTVVVDGINDNHVPEITRVVRHHGAGIINIVPRLSVTGNRFQPPVENNQLSTLQQEASSIMPVFTRCKQCRADAEGIPGRGDSYGQ